MLINFSVFSNTIINPYGKKDSSGRSVSKSTRICQMRNWASGLSASRPPDAIIWSADGWFQLLFESWFCEKHHKQEFICNLRLLLHFMIQRAVVSNDHHTVEENPFHSRRNLVLLLNQHKSIRLSNHIATSRINKRTFRPCNGPSLKNQMNPKWESTLIAMCPIYRGSFHLSALSHIVSLLLV